MRVMIEKKSHICCLMENIVAGKHGVWFDIVGPIAVYDRSIRRGRPSYREAKVNTLLV